MKAQDFRAQSVFIDIMRSPDVKASRIHRASLAITRKPEDGRAPSPSARSVGTAPRPLPDGRRLPVGWVAAIVTATFLIGLLVLAVAGAYTLLKEVIG